MQNKEKEKKNYCHFVIHNTFLIKLNSIMEKMIRGKRAAKKKGKDKINE